MEEVSSDVVQVMVAPLLVAEEAVSDITAVLVSMCKAMLPELAVVYALSTLLSSIVFTLQ